MALPSTIQDRDFRNFDDNGDGTTSRFVSITGGIGSFLEGVTFDYLSASYPNSTTEVYTYKSGGSGGITVAVLTVVYTTVAKDFVSSVART
jgi:hypothetical protein